MWHLNLAQRRQVSCPLWSRSQPSQLSRMHASHVSSSAGSTVDRQLQIVKFLVEKGAVSKSDHKGRTAYEMASLAGHLKIVYFLLLAGANISHLNA